MAKDPICGMDIKEKCARHILHSEHETLVLLLKSMQRELRRSIEPQKSSKGKRVFRKVSVETGQRQ